MYSLNNNCGGGMIEMQHSKSYLALMFLSIFTLILGGCASSDDDSGANEPPGKSDPINVSQDEAQQAAVGALFKGLSGNLGNINTMLFGDQATGESGVVSSITENEQLTGVLGEETTGSLSQATSTVDLIPFINDFIGDDEDLRSLIPEEDTTTEQYIAAVDALVDAYMNEPLRVGNTITYTLNSAAKDEICADATSTEEMTNCELLLSTLSIVQVLSSETSGTVTISTGNNTLVTIGYSEAEVYFETSLADLKSALETLEPLLTDAEDPNPIDLPTIFTGTLRLTLATSSASELSIKFGIIEAFRVEGQFDDDTVDLNIAESPELFVYNATDTSEEVSLSMGTMSMVMSGLADTPEQPDAMELSMGGLSANISIDTLSNEILITNTGITNSISLKLGANTSSLSELVNITLDSFGATISEADSSIVFDTDFNLGIMLTDSTGLISSLTDDSSIDLTNASVSISATENTELAMIGDTESTSLSGVPQVVAGNLEISSTGEGLQGGVSFSDGDCIGVPTDNNATYFIAVVECPTTP